MPHLQEGLNRLKDFVGFWSKNIFTFAMRTQLLTQYSEFFNVLEEKEGFKKYEIGSLDDKNIRGWIENDPFLKDFEFDEVFEFLKNIPEKTPLMLKMAFEIFQMNMAQDIRVGIKSPAYENPGKFYSNYFSARLRREQERQGHSPESRILLETILENVAYATFNQQENVLSIRDIFQIIKDTILSEPSQCLSSLKMADILSVNNDDKVLFVHATFYDFFLARYYANNSVTPEVIKLIEQAGRHQVLLFLAGIVDSETVDLIVSNCQYIGNRIHCTCNAGSISPHTITSTTDEIINWIETNNKSILEIFPYIIQYGPRLCGKKLFDYYESRSKENRQWAVDWEIVKALKLNVGEIDESVQASFQFPDDTCLYRVLHPDRGYTELLETLRREGAVVGRKGFDFYLQLVKDDYEGCWMLANDISISDLIRVIAFDEILWRHQDKIDEIIGILYSNQEKYFCENESIAWVASGFFLNRITEVVNSDCGKSIHVFWKTPFFPVQIRIAYFISQRNGSKSDVSEYFRRIIVEYSSNELVSNVRIEDLRDMSVCSSLDIAFESGDPLIFDYTIENLDGLPCEVVMKLFSIFALDNDIPESALEYLKEHLNSDSEIIRNICTNLLARFNVTLPTERRG
jgi:hypothetical protein